MLKSVRVIRSHPTACRALAAARMGTLTLILILAP